MRKIKGLFDFYIKREEKDSPDNFGLEKLVISCTPFERRCSGDQWPKL